MAVHLKIVGILLMALGIMHVFFPKYFDWKESLKSLSLINRQMMLVHVFFIALTVFLMGLLCVVYTQDLMVTKLGKAIALALSVFWTTRLLVQFFGYAPELWQGKPFETAVHVVFSFLWAYFSGVFLLVSVSY